MSHTRDSNGFRNKTVYAEKTNYLYYECEHCGFTQTRPVLIRKSAQAFFHVQESPETRQEVEAAAKQKALRRVEAEDRALYDAFNVRPNYEVFREKVVCSSCSRAQCWSVIPPELKQAEWLRPWIILTAAAALSLAASLLTVLGSSGSAGSAGKVWLAGNLVSAALLMLPIVIHFIRRRHALEKVRTADFRPPLYFNDSNMSELETMEVDGAETQRT